jgi:hypothetical protein
LCKFQYLDPGDSELSIALGYNPFITQNIKTMHRLPTMFTIFLEGQLAHNFFTSLKSCTPGAIRNISVVNFMDPDQDWSGRYTRANLCRASIYDRLSSFAALWNPFWRVKRLTKSISKYMDQIDHTWDTTLLRHPGSAILKPILFANSLFQLVVKLHINYCGISWYISFSRATWHIAMEWRDMFYLWSYRLLLPALLSGKPGLWLDHCRDRCFG